VLTLGFALAGCATGAADRSLVNRAIPLEKHCVLTLSSGGDGMSVITIKQIDGKTVFFSGGDSPNLEIMLPPGAHSIIADWTGYVPEGTYYMFNLSITFDFVPGRRYILGVLTNQIRLTGTARLAISEIAQNNARRR
jgi:hypothetical protein